MLLLSVVLSRATVRYPKPFTRPCEPGPRPCVQRRGLTRQHGTTTSLFGFEIALLTGATRSCLRSESAMARLRQCIDCDRCARLCAHLP